MTYRQFDFGGPSATNNVVPANARALGDSLHASVWHETVRPGGV
jgi:hypothetical protein